MGKEKKVEIGTNGRLPTCHWQQKAQKEQEFALGEKEIGRLKIFI